MVNPFDLKTALLAKHAQHVVLIHFPIALFLAGAAFDFLAQWTKRQSLAAAAHGNLLMAAVATLPTIVTGLLAWQWQLEGQRLKGVLLLHLISGLASSLLIWIVWLMHQISQRRRSGASSRYGLAVEGVAALLVVLTGHLGGFLSGVNGPS